ncbi:MAG TPA: hypothetical protein VHQ94_23755 [Pyrinomonadaceae bacterium]|nr:hypothetical protein [Pyrinomonadaceae bacterium]
MKSLAPHKNTSNWRRVLVLSSFIVAAVLLLTTTSYMAAPNTGAIFTTDVSCNGTNINIFISKSDVFIDGGPAHEGAAGLPDGSYYIQVTEPGGALLGTSVGSATPTPIHVTNGEFDVCYQLEAVVIKASDSTPGYDDTTNGGGEYKVWVSPNSDFSGGKTDNFKVKPEVPASGTLNVNKFYDANANGINDDGQSITGWKIRIVDDTELFRFTPVSVIVAPDDYVVSEFDPSETNWVHTTANPVNVTVGAGETKTVEFGNLCLGPGGGHTLGFWSNRNGLATMNDGGSVCSELALLNGLYLRNGAGTRMNFGCDYNAFRNWLLSASATNMAYMLSAQLAAMELNVEAGFVNGSALVYAPGTNSANGLGFATVNALMTEANTELTSHATALAGDSWRSYQEALKNALDKANNNQTFVQPTACTFTF